MSKRLLRRFSLLIVGLVAIPMAITLMAPAARASSTLDQGTYTLAKGKESSGNLYLNAGDIVIDGTLKGDLVAMATNVTINGTVTGSLIVASPHVTINGTVGGSVRTISQDLTVNGTVGSDITSVADTLLLAKQATVGESLYAAGNTITVSGKVAGTVRTAISSQIPSPTVQDRIYAIAMGFLSLALLGLVIYSLEPQEEGVARYDMLKEAFSRNVLIGLATTIIAPIVIVILLLSSIGRTVGLLMLFGLACYVILAIVDAAYFLGRIVLFRMIVSQRYGIGVFLLGALLFIILFHLPILALIPLILVLGAFGARLSHFRKGLSISLFRPRHG